MPDTYKISVWDHEADDWEAVEIGLTKWQIRVTIYLPHYENR